MQTEPDGQRKGFGVYKLRRLMTRKLPCNQAHLRRHSITSFRMDTTKR